MVESQNSDRPHPPTILLVTHVIPFPPSAGNEIRILKMLKWLKKEGYRIVLLLNVGSLDPGIRQSMEGIVDRVHLVSDDYGAEFKQLRRRTDYLELLKEKVGALFGHSFLNRLFPEKTQRKIRSYAVKKSLAPDRLVRLAGYLCEKYDPCAMIAEYIFTAPCLDTAPASVLKIIDAHDVFSRRNPKETLYCSQEEERNFLLKSDVIMAIQPEEAKYFKESVPERKTITAGVDCEVVPMVDNSRVVPGRILLVGSDNMANLRGLKSFFSDSWPLIRGRNPSASLRIVGKVGAKFNYSDERVSVRGWVEDLMQEYEQACIVINPTTYGTGLKIKTLEALCRAKPLVATSNSIELSFKGSPPCVVSDNWKEFADRIIHLLGDGGERQRLQNMALSFARENFVPEKVYAELALVLDQAGGTSK